MKRRVFWGILLIGVALAVSCAGRQTSSGPDEVDIVMGTLSSAGTLVTEKGEAYVISPEDEGAELLKNVGKQAIVTGYVLKKGGRSVITVSSYQVMEKTAGGKKRVDD